MWTVAQWYNSGPNWWACELWHGIDPRLQSPSDIRLYIVGSLAAIYNHVFAKDTSIFANVTLRQYDLL